MWRRREQAVFEDLMLGSIEEDESDRKETHKPSVPRPLLYCNYTREFFEDPKNWRNKEKLFLEVL